MEFPTIGHVNGRNYMDVFVLNCICAGSGVAWDQLQVSACLAFAIFISPSLFRRSMRMSSFVGNAFVQVLALHDISCRSLHF